MRALSALLIAVAAILSALAPALAQHPGVMPPMPPVEAADALELLHEAQYFTVELMEGEFPQGSFEVYDSVVAVLPGEYPHGLVIGGLGVDFYNLPAYTAEDGALNLFREIDGPDSTMGFFGLVAGYVSASASSGLSITDEGNITAQRTWAELTDTERAQFEQVFAQCASDGWTEGRSAALREPVGSEIFAALWVPGEDGGLGTRWDFRADADGAVGIEEYARGITWYAYPWAREEGEAPDALRFNKVAYEYDLHPQVAEGAGHPNADSPYGSVDVKVIASLQAVSEASSPTLVSDPYILWESVRIAEVVGGKPAEFDEAEFTRLPEPNSPWLLQVDWFFEEGVEYALMLDGHCTIPETYASFGYGGAYRFDSTALWSGEEHPVDITIDVTGRDAKFKAVASGVGRIDPDVIGWTEDGMRFTDTYAYYPFEQSTRNPMLVLTQFPRRSIETSWGELEVYAPADLIDGVEQTEAVQAIGPIIDYYNAIWGDRGVAKLPVFILPDETGVQGFMSAGMVFILGGSGGHGGAGSAMGGLTALLAHELSHLWWGQDVSTPRWFTEAMANYGAAKFAEQQALSGGGGDPYSYRRYLMNFALGYELPLSLERRDELDDSASIYHNGPATLLTFDARLPHGLDPLLAELWRSHSGEPELSHEELRAFFFSQGNPQLVDLWDGYVERGIIPATDNEDETYRELVRTPERENYRRMLEWLMPARRKAMLGDYAGAMYCANSALEYRSEPKDYQWLAELAFQAGRVDEAIERCIVIMEDQQPDAVVAVKVHYLLANCYAEQGENALAIPEYQWVAEHGMEAGQISLVQDARAQLADLGADVPEEPEVDAQTGATPNPHGH